MTLQSRDDYIHFVEVGYFGALQNGDYDAVLAHYAPGASLTGYASDSPPRVMTRTPRAGEASLDDFMMAGAGLELTYLDFVHTVDRDLQRVASHFTLLFRPKQRTPGVDVPVQRMRNCSFFQFADGRLTHVVAYFAREA